MRVSSQGWKWNSKRFDVKKGILQNPPTPLSKKEEVGNFIALGEKINQ